MLKRTQISVAVGAALGFGMAGLAPAALAQQQQPQQQQLERVEITGSSIKRIEGETALPVQVITREDIQRTGAANVEQLLQTVSAATSSGNNVAASASGASTFGITGISLRGLTSLRTLVLINGKRITPYGYGFTNDASSVDVGTIPIAAIERVEILKDGASAVYGSDAIAGVVNFILRKDYRGLEVGVEYGTPRSSAGSLYRVFGTYGFGDLNQDRFNMMVTLTYDKEKILRGADRNFADSGINVEAGHDTTSGNTFPANIVAADGSFGTRNPSFPACPGPYAINSPLFAADGYLGCRYDPSPQVTLLPETERTGIFASGRFRLTPNAELYGEASFAKREAKTVIQPTPVSDQFAFPPNHPLFNVSPYDGFNTILLSPSSPFYPTAFVQSQTGGATPDLLVRWRAAALGDREQIDTGEATRLNFGAKGVVAGWDYDAGFLFSGSKATTAVGNGFALYTRLMPLLNSGTINFFGPQTPAGQAALDATKYSGDVVEIETSLQQVYGKVSRDLFQLGSAGMVATALGAEFRKEKYKMDPIPQILIGDLTGFGGNFLPVDRSRDVYSLFAELNIPILRGLETNLAVRYDDYDVVGSKTTGKASIRWQPTRQLLLRAAAGTGFRAPSLLDLYAPPTTGVTVAGVDDPLRCPTTGDGNDCNTQFPVTNGGSESLKPEKSENFTLGIVLEPTNNVSIGIDYFNIKLEDTITNGIPPAIILASPASVAQYAALITRGPVDPAFPGLPGPIVDVSQRNINSGETKLSGIEVDAKWGIPTAAFGKFTLGLAGTYYRKYQVQNPDGSFSNAIDTANNSTGGVIPRWKHYATLNWAVGPWSTTLAQNYQGDYQDLPSAYTGADRVVSKYTTYDLQTVYSGLKNLTLTFGVRNLFDEPPPYTNSGGFVYFQGGYDPGYVDPRGRFFYGRAVYKFF